jgi:hypothetical protein
VWYIFLVVDFVALGCLVYVTHKVLVLTKFKVIRIAILLLFMNLTLFFNMILHIMVLNEATVRKEDRFYQRDYFYIPITMGTCALMLEFTVLINLNNWGFYLIKIKETSVKNKSKL